MNAYARVLFALALTCCAQWPAQASMDGLLASPQVTDANGLKVPVYMQSACDWRGALVGSVVSNSEGRVKAGAAAMPLDQGKVLTLEVTLLSAPPAGDFGKRRLGVRARIYFDGKWVAVRNFEDRKMANAAIPVCDAISSLAQNLGGDMADWIKESDMPVCDSACTGLHPDQPIAVARQLLEASPGVFNADVKACGKWSTQMVADFVEDANDMDPPLAAKLVITDEDILKYPGRKLVLKVVGVDLGGAGPEGKWLRMSGELIDGGVIAGSFTTFQKIRIGFGTCRTLNGLGENTYQSIEPWLLEPTTKAELR
jgi:hypothetical protein